MGIFKFRVTGFTWGHCKENILNLILSVVIMDRNISAGGWPVNYYIWKWVAGIIVKGSEFPIGVIGFHIVLLIFKFWIVYIGIVICIVELESINWACIVAIYAILKLSVVGRTTGLLRRWAGNLSCSHDIVKIIRGSLDANCLWVHRTHFLNSEPRYWFPTWVPLWAFARSITWHRPNAYTFCSRKISVDLVVVIRTGLRWVYR